jgi:hypothetical protein
MGIVAPIERFQGLTAGQHTEQEAHGGRTKSWEVIEGRQHLGHRSDFLSSLVHLDGVGTRHSR